MLFSSCNNYDCVVKRVHWVCCYFCLYLFLIKLLFLLGDWFLYLFFIKLALLCSEASFWEISKGTFEGIVELISTNGTDRTGHENEQHALLTFGIMETDWVDGNWFSKNSYWPFLFMGLFRILLIAKTANLRWFVLTSGHDRMIVVFCIWTSCTQS